MPTIATDLASRRIAWRSLAVGPIQVRCDFSSFANGELAGMSQVSPLANCTVSISSTVAVLMLLLREISTSSIRGCRGQSLVKVINDVLRVLYSHADAHDAGQHARVEQLLLGELGVGRG